MRHRPHPDFREMVGRRAGEYCPALPPTELVDAATTSPTAPPGAPTSQVEAAARASLDDAAARTPAPVPVDRLG